MPDEHAVRRDRLREAVRRLDADAALLTDLVTVRYLTGFTGSNAALLVGADGTADRFCTDFRYVEQSRGEVPDLPLVVDRDSAVTLAADLGRTRVAFESRTVSVDTADDLAEAAPNATWVRLGAAVETLRAVKDATEVALVAEACRIADRALADLVRAGGLHPGVTERDAARDLDRRMLEHGAEAPSFATILASGPHSAVPHHQPTDRPLETGDLVKLDFGATYAGYHSDMTRTMVLGPPADWQVELHALVERAQAAGCAALRIGATGVELDRAAREVIADAGHAEHFGHGLGHGVGLQIHEAPWLGERSGDTIEGRTTVTVEPGVYLPGRGGVRIEDTLDLQDDDTVQVLTQTTRDLLVL